MQPVPMRTILAYGSNVLAVFIFWHLNYAGLMDPFWCFISSAAKVNRPIFEDAANSTLGFQKIFIIDSSSDPELRNLVSFATALTPDGGLDVEYIDSHTAGSDHFRNGAGDAQRGHMDALRTIVEQEIESALVFETTMDWNRDLKARMRELASATRYLVQPDSEGPEQPRTSSPYGDTSLWDAIFLNHCGIDDVEFGAKKGAGKVLVPEHASAEPEVPLAQNHDQQPTEQVRKLGHATNPGQEACPMAYGVTQRGARRFLLALVGRAIDYSRASLVRDVCDGYPNGPRHNCLVSEHELFQTRRLTGDGSDDWSMISLATERSM